MSGALPDDWDEGTEAVRMWGRTKEEREAEEAIEKEETRRYCTDIATDLEWVLDDLRY